MGIEETIGIGETLVYVGVILAGFTFLAFVADAWEKAVDRRRRNEARAEARAKRRKETERSEPSEEFSWQ